MKLKIKEEGMGGNKLSGQKRYFRINKQGGF